MPPLPRISLLSLSLLLAPILIGGGLAEPPPATPPARSWDDYLATAPTPLDPKNCISEKPWELFGRMGEQMNLTLYNDPKKDAATRAKFLTTYTRTLATAADRRDPQATAQRPAFRELHDFIAAAFARAPRAKSSLSDAERKAFIERSFSGGGLNWASFLGFSIDDTAGYIRARLILAGSTVPAPELDLFRGQLAAKLRRYTEQPSTAVSKENTCYALIAFAQSYRIDPPAAAPHDEKAPEAAASLWKDYLLDHSPTLEECLAHAPSDLFHLIGRRDNVSLSGMPGGDATMIDTFYAKYAHELATYNDQHFPERVTSRLVLRDLLYFTIEGLVSGFGQRFYSTRERIDAYVEHIIATTSADGVLPGARKLDFSAQQAASYARARLVMIAEEPYSIDLDGYRTGVATRIHAAANKGAFTATNLAYLVALLADNHQTPLDPKLGPPEEP
ncbi:hypothetical protein [Luteolibacter soli]|uniref:DUF1592 domain-containing protein n=1 Tax=Luteolibacter soli TaxID=3135280 RepID=A0ABU9AW05_9BACT